MYYTTYKTRTNSVAQSSGDSMMPANYPEQINAGTSGDCATYHIEDEIKSPLLKQGGDLGVVLINSNKRGGFKTRQSREDGVCYFPWQSRLARLDGIAGQALMPNGILRSLPDIRLAGAQNDSIRLHHGSLIEDSSDRLTGYGFNFFTQIIMEMNKGSSI